MSSNKSSGGRIFWGLTLIVLGVLFLLDQMGRLDFGEFVGRYWPAIFLIIGISILINQRFRNAGAGFFFIIFGGVFLLMKMRILRQEFWHLIWPLLIIAAGAWLLLRPALSSKTHEDKKKIPESSSPDLKISAVLSGIKRRIESPAFRGGEVEVVLGSADIDMSQAVLEGGKADLSLSVVLGEIIIHAPKEWRIVMTGTPVLGNIDDKRTPLSDLERKGDVSIKAAAVLGSIEIRN